MNNNNVLHLIKTHAYQSDGRLLKWVDSLRKEGVSSEVFILEDANVAGTQDEAGSQVTRISLKTRKYFKKRKGYLWKIPEFSWKTIRFVKRHSAKILIFHDVQHYLTLILLLLMRPKGKFIVWDLHELPHERLLTNIITKKILRYILNSVDTIVYTNVYRRTYLQQRLAISHDKGVVLHNFPDTTYIDAKKNPEPTELKDWLDGRKYVLWMGMASKGRNFLAFYEGVRSYLGELRLVIIGKISNDVAEILNEHPESAYVYNRFVSQHEIIQYIDNAQFSVVLYKNTSPNNWYCEPNRLYQLLTRGVPVIGGNNPQIARFLSKCRGGVVLQDDGTNVDTIKLAVETLISDNNELLRYQGNLRQFDFVNDYSWNADFNKLFEFLKNRFIEKERPSVF